MTDDKRRSDEVFTPPELIRMAREAMGGIDVDPASCPAAQQVVLADCFFAREDDGLAFPWHGNVWLNPPFKDSGPRLFARRLIAEIDLGNVEQAMFLCIYPGGGLWPHEAFGSASHWLPLRSHIPWWGPGCDSPGMVGMGIWGWVEDESRLLAAVEEHATGMVSGVFSSRTARRKNRLL